MPEPGRFDRLDAAQVEATLDQLHLRIVSAMPGRHLADVVEEVRQVVVVIDKGARAVRRRAAIGIGSWALIAALVVLVVAGVASAVHTGLAAEDDVRGFEWFGVVESGVNDVVFAAVAIWFLQGLPARLERRRLLRILYRLRSLAHVTDMHQMSKYTADGEVRDDDAFPADAPDADAPAAAPRLMDEDDLVRYLEFCSSLLSLTAKAAALCGENTTDAVVLDTVSEIETLTASMSRKVWQKISLLRMAPVQG